MTSDLFFICCFYDIVLYYLIFIFHNNLATAFIEHEIITILHGAHARLRINLI